MEDIRTKLETIWANIVKELLRSEYTYIITSEEAFSYGSYFDLDLKSGKVVEIDVSESMGFTTVVKLTYNGFDNTMLFGAMFSELTMKFQNDYLYFIDSNIYSVGDRTKYFLDKLSEIKVVRKQMNKRKSVPLHPLTEVQVFLDNEANSDAVHNGVSAFTSVQSRVLTGIEAMLQNTMTFISGRIDDDGKGDENLKLNFNLSRAELIILLVAMRDSEIIDCRVDNQLALFAEGNLLAKGSPLKLVRNAISKYFNQEDNSDVAFKTIREKMNTLKLIKKIIT